MGASRDENEEPLGTGENTMRIIGLLCALLALALASCEDSEEGGGTQ